MGRLDQVRLAVARMIAPRASAYDSGSQQRRARTWQPTTENINALLSGEVDTIRRRARDEIRKNPWAARGLSSWVANIVGTGIRPNPNTEDSDLKREIQAAWDEWCDEADADGCSPFYGLQALVARSFSEGGDCFVRLRVRRPEDGLSVPLQLQVLEAEMVDPTLNRLPTGQGFEVRAGIEFNVLGQRTVYHMFRAHPGERFGRLRGAGTTVPVPANQVIHVFPVLRPGQIRGVPGLATVLAMLHDIREVDDAHVMRAKIQNLYATFETIPSKDDGSVLDGASVEYDEDDAEIPTTTAAAGSHVLLPAGHDIKFGEPPTGSIDYEAFIRTKLRSVAAGAGVTYEQLSNDLSGVNFSSIRAGLIEMRREFELIQRNVLIFQFCRPVWRRWLETAVLSGRIDIPASALPALLRARWQPPGWEYVEPEKDIRTAVRKIRAGLSSRTLEAAKMGLDIELLDAEIAADNARAKALGLILDSDAGATSAAGVGQASGSVPSQLQELDDDAQREDDEDRQSQGSRKLVRKEIKRDDDGRIRAIVEEHEVLNVIERDTDGRISAIIEVA